VDSALAPGLLSIARYVPPYRYDQPTVTAAVREWLEEGGASARLLSVYQNAGVLSRGSVAPIEEVFHPRDFESRNDRYRAVAAEAAPAMAKEALERAELAPRDVSLLVSVSCTGFMIPAVDAHVANALGMGPRLARLPITESGCAGGVVGLARATDYLRAHPERAALVLAIEMASLTFQRWDRSPTNVVSSAIFGDGGAAVVLVGARHPLAARAALRILDAESVFFPDTTHLMGFRLRNQGLQIVLDRDLAPFVRREVAPAVDGFLAARGLRREDVARWVMHPGGRRIIEVMCERLGLEADDMAATEAVLSQHGNMSSVTVLFVLDEILRHRRPEGGARGVLGAFGPGFGAELALLQFS
jgi:alkylresorcinol/alkylpyrone synthase